MNDTTSPTSAVAPRGWPRFEPDEIEATTAVLSSGRVNYWTGDEGRGFERELAERVGVAHAIALANGTVAIELALWAFGIDEGEVIVPARTFVATASAVRMRGATPVFADVDPDSGCVTAATIEAVATERTRAVIVVHLGGWPCDIDEIVAQCGDHRWRLFEDCAQAIGATHRGRTVGSFGDAATFSFCQDKIVTTAGEGGALVTDDEARARLAWSYKDHGKDWTRVHERERSPGFRWLHARVGTNWRLSEVQAAVGRVQLGKLDAWLTHRRAMSARWVAGLSAVPGLRVPVPARHVQSACYKQYAYVRPEALRPGWDRNRVLATLHQRGVQAGSGSCSEVYLEDAIPEAVRPPSRLPVARALGETSLMFLVDPTVTAEAVARDCATITDVMGEAVR